MVRVRAGPSKPNQLPTHKPNGKGKTKIKNPILNVEMHDV